MTRSRRPARPAAKKRGTSLARVQVGELVRRAMGGSLVEPREHRRLVKRFVEAGRQAVLADRGTPQQAARAIQAFEALRGSAMKQVAARTRPGHGPVILDPDWRETGRALERHRRRLERYPNVVGYGLGCRHRRGEEHDERCITVFVSKKLPPDQLRALAQRLLPSQVAGPSGRPVALDVVEAGPLERQFVAGSSLGPSATQIKGTIGAYARETPSGASVALTAMHVATGHTRFVVPSPRDNQVGEPLGRFLDGTMQRIDAAKISVDPPATAELFLPGIGPIRGWRPMVIPGDRGREVRMFGATSGRQRGFIAEPAISLPSEGLEQAILVDIPTDEGDSGCAIVDSENLVLGLLVGKIRINGLPLRAFSPISLVLDILGCDISTPTT